MSAHIPLQFFGQFVALLTLAQAQHAEISRLSAGDATIVRRIHDTARAMLEQSTFEGMGRAQADWALEAGFAALDAIQQANGDPAAIAVRLQ